MCQWCGWFRNLNLKSSAKSVTLWSQLKGHSIREISPKFFLRGKCRWKVLDSLRSGFGRRCDLAPEWALAVRRPTNRAPMERPIRLIFRRGSGASSPLTLAVGNGRTTPRTANSAWRRSSRNRWALLIRCHSVNPLTSGTRHLNFISISQKREKWRHFFFNFKIFM